MKDGLYEKYFAADDAVIVAIRKWLLKTDRNFYKREIQASVQRWSKCIKSGGKLKKLHGL
jgi:hypothetical protein